MRAYFTEFTELDNKRVLIGVVQEEMVSIPFRFDGDIIETLREFDGFSDKSTYNRVTYNKIMSSFCIPGIKASLSKYYRRLASQYVMMNDSIIKDREILGGLIASKPSITNEQLRLEIDDMYEGRKMDIEHRIRSYKINFNHSLDEYSKQFDNIIQILQDVF